MTVSFLASGDAFPETSAGARHARLNSIAET